MRAVHVKIYLPEFVFRLRVWVLLRYRRLRYGYAFRKIGLTQGKYTVVDLEDYEQLGRYKWHASRSKYGIYAVRKFWTKEGSGVKQKSVSMHQVIMGSAEGKVIDHINHNGLDNRRANLRFVTMQQNSWNKRKNRGNYSSRYKGVAWSKSRKKWRTRITWNGRWIFLGYFEDEEAAAMAYDAKAKELFGDYASLNLSSSKRRG